jgi:RNA polymerase sigma-70 factor (ECF subfamily)
MNEETSDEALMLRYQSGDAAAFDALYARHRGGLYRFILRQGRLGDHAEELFQDVWMNLIKARATYRVEAQFRTWLYTLARNRVLDFFRSDGRAGAVMREAGADEDLENVAGSRVAEPGVRAESREQGEAVVRLLQALPAPQREAFLLYQEGGLSVEDIAAATGVSFEAAKSRLRYAVAKLREGLQDYR